jgi:arylsulfatase A-like enzyme
MAGFSTGSPAPGIVFLAFLNYFDAHEPYIPRPPFETAFGARCPDYLLHCTPSGVGRDNITHLSAAEIEPQRNAYDASLAYLDRHVGQLLDELERRGVLDNTIVIITSDHGEMFGEHGIMGHVGRTYLTVLEVPLLVSFPAGGLPAGRTLSGSVILHDLPATVMDLLGASEAGPFPGRSLRRYWESAGEPAEPEPLLSEGNPDLGRKSLVLGRYHLVHRYQASDTTPELYDSETDPLEQNNLVGDPAHAAVLERMRFLLDSMMARGVERNAMR